MAITRSKNQAKRSEQNILVASYDEDYDVLAVELLGEDTSQLRKLQSDSSGFLKVNVAAGGAGDGAILDGVTSSIKATVLDYTNSNPLAVRLTDTAGDYVGAGAGTQYTEDAAAAANPVGTAVNLIRTDTPATQVTTDGDNVAQRGTNYGAAYVQLVTSAGAYIDSVGGGTQYAVDAALGATPTGTLAIAIRDDALSALTPVEGDAIGLRVDANGALWVIPSGTTIVSATNLDIRDIDAATDDIGIHGSVGLLQQAVGGDLKVTLDSESVAVTGTFWQATQPVSIAAAVAVTQSGTWDEVGINDSGNAITVDWAGTAPPIGAGLEATALRVTIATDSTGVLSVDDNSSSLTVDNAGLTELAAAINASSQMDVNIAASGATVPVSGTFWQATQPVSIAATVGVDVSDEATRLLGVVYGSQGAQIQQKVTTNDLIVTLDGESVAVTGTFWQATQPVSGTVTANAGTGTFIVGDAGAIINLDASGDVQADILTIAAGDNNIGNVDIVSGTITTVSTVTALGAGTTGPMKAEDVAHSTGDQGFPAWGVRQDTPNATAAASNDYHYLATDMVGGIRTALYETDFAVLGTNHVKKYYANTGAVTDGIVWSPAAGKRWYITDIFVGISAAATVTLEDDLTAGDSTVWAADLAANSGWSHHFSTPLFSGEDAVDLIVTTTAGNVKIMVVGYEI